MSEQRKYLGGAQKLTLKQDLDPTGLNLFLNEPPNGWIDTTDALYDNLPFWAAIDRGKPTEEKIDCESITPDGSGGAVIVVRMNGRGADGTAAKTHKASAVVEMVWTASDARSANEHVNTDEGAHGLPAGTRIVGDTNAQYLTNKTIDADDLRVKLADGNFHRPLYGQLGETLNKPTITDPISTVPPLTVGPNHTLGLPDQSCILEPTDPGANTITIPDDATVAFPVGTVIGAAQVGGKIHFTAAPGVTVDTPNGPYSLGANAVVFMWKRKPNLWLLIGDLTNSAT